VVARHDGIVRGLNLSGPMKILQFGKFYPPHIGGIERVMFDLTEGINARSIGCDVLCSNDTKTYVDEVIKTYHVIRTPTYGIYYSASITPQIIGKLRRIQADYDIIHVHLPDPTANLALYLARPPARVILHWHNDIVRQRMLLRFYLPFQTWMLRRADAVITTSPNYIEGSSFLGPYRDKCHVVPIGVSREDMNVDPDMVGRIKARFPGKRIVFSIGRLSQYKGYEYLIEAARYLADDYVVLIAGRGPLRERLLRQISDSGLSGKVFLLGPVKHEQVGSYYDACDVYCLSSISKNEGFGLVQLEAMLFKKPVVSTNVEGSGVTWANLDGETGLVVEPASPEALARAVEKICSDQALYDRLAGNGLRRVTEEFTKQRMIDATIEIYRSLLGGDRQGSAGRP
jgi:glycosyltransferase involved in cell wall biosynthesis